MEKNVLISSNIYAIILQAFLFTISFLPFAEASILADLSSRIIAIALIILFLINIYMEKAGKTYTGRWGRPLSPTRASMGIGIGCFGGLPWFFIACSNFYSFDALAITFLMLMIITGVIAILGGVLREKSYRVNSLF